MMKNLSIGLFVLAVLSIGVYFLTQNKQSLFTNRTVIDSALRGVVPTAVPKDTIVSTDSAVVAGEIEVKGNEYSFSPKSIDLKAVETVNIKFTNAGNLPHNLVVSGLNAQTQVLNPGGEETIKVTAPKAGTYAFYCSVGNHRQLGMEGKLEVK